MLSVNFSNWLQIHHQYEWNLFIVKTNIKKYQNESESYYEKYVFKVSISRSKQHDTKRCLNRNTETFNMNMINYDKKFKKEIINLVLKEQIGCRIKSLKCNQNSCNSLEAVKPQFNVGLCFLIISASLKSKTFQLFPKSIIKVLTLIYNTLNWMLLKVLVSIVNKSAMWL